MYHGVHAHSCTCLLVSFDPEKVRLTVPCPSTTVGGGGLRADANWRKPIAVALPLATRVLSNERVSVRLCQPLPGTKLEYKRRRSELVKGLAYYVIVFPHVLNKHFTRAFQWITIDFVLVSDSYSMCGRLIPPSGFPLLRPQPMASKMILADMFQNMRAD